MKKFVIIMLLYASITCCGDEINTIIQRVIISIELNQKSTQELKAIVKGKKVLSQLFVEEQLKQRLLQKQKNSTKTPRNLISRINLLKCYKKNNCAEFNEKELNNLELILTKKIDNELAIAKDYPNSQAKKFLTLVHTNKLFSENQQQQFNALHNTTTNERETNLRRHHNPPLLSNTSSTYTLILCMMGMLLHYFYC